MQYTLLGRTGLRVSVAGLGCGGGSKLGYAAGKSKKYSVRLVKSAIDCGINLIDTANGYGNEEVIGDAIKGVPRDQVVISTKFHPAWAGVVNSAETIVDGLNNSLKLLGVDYIDIFHLHGLYPRYYDHVLKEVVPVLLREKEKGKFRHLGVTENAPGDHHHKALQMALNDDCFDVLMVAYHVMNQNAEKLVFPRSLANGVGTLIMFAVRRIFSKLEYIKAEVGKLVEQGQLPEWMAEKSNPLDFLLHDKGASTIVDACYRYVRHHEGSDVVLFGTGSIDHLKSNIVSINKPPLPREDTEKIRDLFSHLEGVGLDYPGGSGPKVEHNVINVELATSGLKCPLPVLKTKKALREMESGEVVRVSSTDPSSAVDFIDYCDNSGNQLLDSSKKEDLYVYIIRKS